MTHSQTPEELAFQRSIVTLNSIRHGINLVSDKAFAENLISESNKSRQIDVGDVERTKALLTALLDRIKSRPQTFGTIVHILKESSGMNYIGEELQKNLEKVRMELTIHGISHRASYITPEIVSFPPTDVVMTRNGSPVISPVGCAFAPSIAPFTQQSEYETPPSDFNMRTHTLAMPALLATPILAMPTPSCEHGSETHKGDMMAKSPMTSPEDKLAAMRALISRPGEAPSNPLQSQVTGLGVSSSDTSFTDSRTNHHVKDPTNFYMRSNSQCSDTDSDYTTPQQSLSESVAEKLFKNISRNTLCKENMLHKTQLLQSQEENRRLKAKLQIQDELMLDQASALTQLKLQCCALENERQEAWRYYDVSMNLLLKNIRETSRLPRGVGMMGSEGNFSAGGGHSQKIAEMLKSCLEMMLPPGVPQHQEKKL